jgi:hypothetical protein
VKKSSASSRGIKASAYEGITTTNYQRRHKKFERRSEVNVLITNNAVYSQKSNSTVKTEFFLCCGVAGPPPGFNDSRRSELSPVFQAGWSDCMFFFSDSLFSFHLLT